MSQINNLGGQQPQVNLNTNAPQAQGPGPQADLPPGLRNAHLAQNPPLPLVQPQNVLPQANLNNAQVVVPPPAPQVGNNNGGAPVKESGQKWQPVAGQPQLEIAQRNDETASQLDKILRDGDFDAQKHPLAPMVREVFTEVLARYELEDHTIAEVLTPEDRQAILKDLRSMGRAATNEDLKSLLKTSLNRAAALVVIRQGLALNSLSLAHLPAETLNALTKNIAANLLKEHPEMQDDLRKCTDRNGVSQLLATHKNIIQQTVAKETLALCVAENMLDKIGSTAYRQATEEVFSALKIAGFQFQGLNPDCSARLAERIRSAKELSPQNLADILHEVLSTDLKEDITAARLKELWVRKHFTDGGRPEAFWKNMARGVMARLAAGNENERQLLQTLLDAPNPDVVLSILRGGAIRSSLLEAMHLGEHAEQAEVQARDAFFARLSRETGVPLHMLTDPQYASFSPDFTSVRDDILAGKIPAQDVEAAFQRKADELAEQRILLHKDAANASAFKEVDDLTREAWQTRVLTAKELPEVKFTDIVNIAKDIKLPVKLGFAVQEKDGVLAYSAVTAFMLAFKDACQKRGLWPESASQQKALTRCAMEYLISSQELKNACSETQFRESLRQEMQAQTSAGHAHAALGELAVGILENFWTNTSVTERLFQKMPLREFDVVSQEVFAEIKGTYGKGPDNMRQIGGGVKAIMWSHIRQLDEPVTPEIYRVMLRETVLADLRQTALVDALKSRWQAQKLDPGRHIGDGYWRNMANGVLELLARGDAKEQALLAGLNNAQTAEDTTKAVAGMEDMLNRFIDIAARADKLAAEAQEHVYSELSLATGLTAQQLSGYKPLKMAQKFEELTGKYLRLELPVEQMGTAFKAEADKLISSLKRDIEIADELDLSPATAKRWKQSVVERGRPPVPFNTFKTVSDSLNLAPLQNALAEYRKVADNPAAAQQRQTALTMIYNAVNAIARNVMQQLFNDPSWPKQSGMDENNAAGYFVSGYLMDKVPELRFALLQPGLALALSEEGSRHVTADNAEEMKWQGIVGNFITGLGTACNTLADERDAELEQLGKNAAQSVREEVSRGLSIPVESLMAINPAGLQARVKELQENIRTGKLPLPGEEAIFTNEAAFTVLTRQVAQPYVDAYVQVDGLPGLSDQMRTQLKDCLLRQSLPLPGGRSIAEFLAVGNHANVQRLNAFTDLLKNPNTTSQQLVTAWRDLARGLEGDLKGLLGEAQWAAMRQTDRHNLLSLVWIGAQAMDPDLQPALAARLGMLVEARNYYGRYPDSAQAKTYLNDILPMLEIIRRRAVNSAEILATSLDHDNHPSPIYGQMLQEGAKYVRERLGAQSLPTGLNLQLDLRLPEHGNRTLREVLQERIRTADHVLTPQELGNLTAKLLLPAAQAQVAMNLLQAEAVRNGMEPLSAEALSFALNALRGLYPEQMQALVGQENPEGIGNVLNAIPAQERLAILRDAHVLEAHRPLALAQSLSNAAGVPLHLGVKALQGQTLDSLYGTGYIEMLRQSRENPNARLSGDALAKWCEAQANTITAPWTTAIHAIKTSALPEASQRLLLLRVFTEPDPSRITGALAAVQQVDVRSLVSVFNSGATATMSDMDIMALLTDLDSRISAAVDAGLQGRPVTPEERIRLQNEARDMLLTLHPELAEKMALPADKLAALTAAISQLPGGENGLALLHAARGRQAQLWMMKHEDATAIRNGTATPEQQQMLDALLREGRRYLAQQQERVHLPESKLTYLRSSIGGILQTGQIRNAAKPQAIADVADYLAAWDDVSPLDASSSPLAEALRNLMQETVNGYTQQEGRYVAGDVFEVFPTDSGRALFIIDGQAQPLNSGVVMMNMMTTVPDIAQRRFISTIMNQQVWSDLNMMQEESPVGDVSLHTLSGAEHMVHGHRNNESVSGQTNRNDNGELSYELRMAPDGRSAVITLTFCQDMLAARSSVNYGRFFMTQEVEVNLEGRPSITGLRVSQRLMPMVGQADMTTGRRIMPMVA